MRRGRRGVNIGLALHPRGGDVKHSFWKLGLLGSLTVLSCGGLTDLGANSSQFLASCPGVECGPGLSCICGTCTRTCSAKPDCSDLANNVVCVDTNGSCSSTPVCAVPCSTNSDCAPVASD